MENQQTITEPPQDDNNVLKPKRKQTLTDEQRAKKADHMRKISLARIEKARLSTEEKLNATEDKVIEKLAKVEDKKQQIRKIKEEKLLPEPKAPPVTPRAKRVKKVVVQESTDSEDYCNESEDTESDDEVIYVAKKPTKKAQDKSIIKPKKEAKMKEIETPKTVIKFL